MDSKRRIKLFSDWMFPLSTQHPYMYDILKREAISNPSRIRKRVAAGM